MILRGEKKIFLLKKAQSLDKKSEIHVTRGKKNRNGKSRDILALYIVFLDLRIFLLITFIQKYPPRFL